MMKEQFPTFNLEDKVLSDGGGNDGKRYAGLSYVRRNKGSIENK